MESTFKEKEPEKKYNITKFKFSCDEKDGDLCKANLPATFNHMWVITAKPRQGKSTYIYNLLTKQNKASPYYRKFDKIYIFSPSLKTIDDDPFETIPDEQKFYQMTGENLQEVYDEIEDSGERVLIIADDVVNDLKKDMSAQTMLCKMMMNRRHICGASGGDSCGFSLLITTQVYNRLKRPLRACASHYTIFKTTNKKELETIYDELMLMDKKLFESLLKYVFDKKYTSLYIDTDKEFDKMYHKNFNRLIMPNSDEDCDC